MFAVIETGGKQLRVEVGDVVNVERVEAEVSSPVVFDRVLLVGQDGAVRVGAPTVAGVMVRGSVVAHDRAKKIVIRTYKHRENASRRSRGHRQHLTRVRIEAIEG
jgi:large subunit ribosomal protein L21